MNCANLFCLKMGIIQLNLLTLLTFTPLVLGMNKMPPLEIKGYPGFERECSRNSTPTECIFQPKGSTGKIYFVCKSSTKDDGKAFCFCGSGGVPRDEIMRRVQWDRLSEKCLVGKGAPCGEDGGLRTECDSDLECIEGRCRLKAEVRSGGPSEFCGDDFDCKQGLECRASETPTVLKIQRCYEKK